jgi:hypothetical protein
MPAPGVAAMARDLPPRQAAGHSRFVVVRDRDGCRKAVARQAVSAVCETEEGGSVLMLPGGRMIQVEEDLDTVLQWLG